MIDISVLHKYDYSHYKHFDKNTLFCNILSKSIVWKNPMNIEKIKAYHCPVEAAMDVIGGKYKALIVYELINGTRRYNEIQKAVPQATARMLSKQLKELEEDEIINRTLYPVVPPKTEYSFPSTHLVRSFTHLNLYSLIMTHGILPTSSRQVQAYTRSGDQ